MSKWLSTRNHQIQEVNLEDKMTIPKVRVKKIIQNVSMTKIPVKESHLFHSAAISGIVYLYFMTLIQDNSEPVHFVTRTTTCFQLSHRHVWLNFCCRFLCSIWWEEIWGDTDSVEWMGGIRWRCNWIVVNSFYWIFVVRCWDESKSSSVLHFICCTDGVKCIAVAYIRMNLKNISNTLLIRK